MKKLYLKYKEIINYLIAGGLTTIVSIGSYELFKEVFHIHYIISNVLSWIAAVLFAYVVNRRFVFYSNTKAKEKRNEFIKFIVSRLVTLGTETLLIYFLVEIVKLNTDIAKIIGQITTIILNYVFSKLFAFKKKK